jgi:hypothetical protein
MTPINHIDLEAAMARYVATPPSERPALLRATLAARPEFTEPLMAAYIVETDEPQPGEAQEHNNAFTAIGNATLAAFLAREDATKNQTLLGRAKDLGLRVQDLALELRLGADVILKLERKLIQIDTIPSILVERLATVLKSSVEQVRGSLEARPVMVTAHFNSRRPPTPQKAEPFAEAIEQSPATAPGDRAYWRSVLAPK